jgi:TonB family protein
MLEELEQQETTQEQLVIPRLEIAAPAPVLIENDQTQRRRMVIALVMLLVALGLVLIKDRDFWFPAPEATESEAFDDTAPAAAEETTQPATSAAAAPTATSTPALKKRRSGAVSKAPTVAPPGGTNVAALPPSGPAVTASRAVLPPLRVEVVAGDQHQLVRPGTTPSVKVELQNGAPGKIASEGPRTPVPVTDSQPITTTGDRVQMSTDTRQALTRPVRPEYPLLARQMRVQGAVVLLVFIDKDGSIENLQIESGPAILADAARAAVKQWRFKPYLQSGVPVATQARVTVDFTIGVAN